MHKIITTGIVTALILVSFFSFNSGTEAYYRPSIYADSVLAYTNVQRYKNGVPLLESDSKLSNIAVKKMRDLFTRQYFDHVAPTGETVSDLAKEEGYAYIVVGENLALGNFTSSKAVVDAWMDSEGHRENILASKYTEIGIAAGRSSFDGSNTWIIVQTFGRPKSSCPIVNSELGNELERLQERLEIYEKVADIRRGAIDNTDSLRVKTEKVEAYNLVAKLYNNLAEKYRALMEEYNESVGEYNQCLESVINDEK